MFGYVTPLKGELKVRELDVFKGYYCGVCTSLGKINYPAKYILNYDMTFLALFLSSIKYDTDRPKRRFCGYKVNKVNYFKNEYIDYSAMMNIILTNRKLLDDYNDDKNYFSFLLSKVFKVKKGEKFRDKIESIDKNLYEMSSLEKQNSSDIDRLSHLFGEITKETFDVLEGKTGEVLKYFGYNLGRWIYVVDALDDLEKDIKEKKYNPLIYAFNYEKEENFRERVVENIRFVLYSYLENITKAYELLDIKKNRGILDNIIYLSLADKTERILKGERINEKSIRGIRCRQERFNGGYKESL
ncbi:DUF5685 family protein [Caloramator sp.]|uniref:DUF5685 family protein n=1 Tax=Caloramator sp. TaxID=1871330 RepID=UPI0025BFD895|nr:DUF5685 family protein [Caloramator sp.]